MDEEKKSWFSEWIKDNHNKIFIAILIFAFIIRVWIFFKTSQQPLWWDEADYLATAKRWAFSLDIRDSWYYRRGFFWPLFSALFFKLGLGEIGIRFSEVLFSTGIVLISYLLISKMFNKKLALLVSLAVSVSWIFLFFTGRPMTDIPAAFFILLSLLFFWKGYVLNENKKFTWLFGLFLALALLTRFQYAMFIPAFLVLIFLKEKFSMFKNKNLWISFLVFALVLFPYFILYWTHYGNVFSDILARYFGVGAEASATTSANKISNLATYIKDLPNMLTRYIYYFFLLGFIIFMFDFIVGIDKIFSNEEIKKKMFILVWLIVPMLVLGYITVYVEQRYVMPLVPFLFVLPFMAMTLILDSINKYLKLDKKIIYFIFILILLFLLYPNFKTGKDMIIMKMTSYSEARQAGIWIKANSVPSDIIVSTSVPQITYYSERSTYGFPLNETEFTKFLETNKPKYMFLSVYEKAPEWTNTYFQNIPINTIKTYSQGNQPVAAIYQFIYS